MDYSVTVISLKHNNSFCPHFSPIKKENNGLYPYNSDRTVISFDFVAFVDQ